VGIKSVKWLNRRTLYTRGQTVSLHKLADQMEYILYSYLFNLLFGDGIYEKTKCVQKERFLKQHKQH
jgi:hypothetical protein